MKRFRYHIHNKTRVSTLLILMLSLCTWAQQEATPNKSSSPYFLIKGDDATTNFPLLETSAKVNIAGVIAEVTVTQKYQNNGNKPIEAIYTFPASAQAAVHAMEMTIGERTIKAIIKEKEQARTDYNTAIKEGKTASLLEQHRPNVFQMNVGNILPSEIIEVQLKYTELLIPINGIYEFVYPTVVGPRYANGNESESDQQWISNPYTEENAKPLYDFDIDITLNTSIPVNGLKCPSHETDIKFNDSNRAAISLKSSDKKRGNKDFILQYQLKGNAIETGILLFEGEKENFFLGMIQPPKTISKTDIPAREYIFIIDISGSMSGFPLDISKKLMDNILNDLDEKDKFNILTFAGSSAVFNETSVNATPENISQARQFVNGQHGGGGTALLPALQRALKMNGDNDYSRSFVILTDGYVSVEKEAFDLIRENLQLANFFPFGIGTSVNRYIMEGMAHVGNTEPLIVTNQTEAQKAATDFAQLIKSPVLTNIKINMEGFEAYDIEPLTPSDVFAEKPVIFYGKYKGNPTGSITITGTSGKQKFNQKQAISAAINSKNNEAIKYLWARERIKLLDDYGKVNQTEALKKQVTELGIQYNLLTAYTSFVAIDSEVRTDSSSPETIVQPLPLPEGVSNYALGTPRKLTSSAKYKSTLMVTEDCIEVADMELIREKDLEDTSFLVVEKMPEYPGGLKAFQTYIQNELNKRNDIPAELKGQRVILQFEVDESGKIVNPKLIRNHNEKLFQLLKGVLLKSPRWKPGYQSGKAVKVQFTIPINL